jgi:hypothetical protein
MRRSRRVALAICLGSIPCLAAAYPAAVWLKSYCDLTPSEVRGVLVVFVLVALILPLVVSLPLRVRRPEGLCRHCGFNLTGNTSGVCPECGTSVHGKPRLSDRPILVRTTVCSLCSETVHVPIEARQWARCSNCGALVPV